MPQTDFYNHNQYIAYPLKTRESSLYPFGSYNLRESALVDMGFVLGIDSAYDPTYGMQLVSIEVAGSLITFVCQDTAATATFRFEFDQADPFGTVVEADAAEGAEFGTGFAVAGDLATLGTEFPNGVHTASESIYIEEGTVQSLYQHYVKQFTIGSQFPTPWHTLAECGGSPSDIYRYKITGRNLTGDRRFKAGYNATISVSERDNAIEIGASQGAGEGEPCEPVDLYGSSQSSLSSVLSSSMSGQAIPISPPRCKDVFNTLNGVRPSEAGEFRLQALSPGLSVRTEPENHKVIIEFGRGAYLPYCEVIDGQSSLLV